MSGNVYQCVCGGVERENANGQIEKKPGSILLFTYITKLLTQNDTILILLLISDTAHKIKYLNQSGQ